MKKYDIVLVKLDPTKGFEKKGTRPAVVVQNNRINESLVNTTVVIPLTTKDRQVYFTIAVWKSKQNGLAHDSTIELTQIRVIDRSRIIKSLGVLDEQYRPELQQKLTHFFDINDEF